MYIVNDKQLLKISNLSNKPQLIAINGRPSGIRKWVSISKNTKCRFEVNSTPSPFPGMDPYLEQARFWSSFHSRLIVAIADTLAPYLVPQYYIDVETRAYLDNSGTELLVGISDAIVFSSERATQNNQNLNNQNLNNQNNQESSSVALEIRPKQVTIPMPIEIKERYLEIREVGTDAVITVIEVLSPKNKRKGIVRQVYEQKRQAILGSLSNLIEIDLLRADKPMTIIGGDSTKEYRILVSHSYKRPLADLYEFALQDSIPFFPLPLKMNDEEPIVNLQEIVYGVYIRASYDLRIDYSQPLWAPKLSEENQQWVDHLLQNWQR
jgi:hypothetical protein